MLPTIGLLIFLKQYIVRSLAGPTPLPGDEGCDSDLDDDDDDDKDKVGAVCSVLSIVIQILICYNCIMSS